MHARDLLDTGPVVYHDADAVEVVARLVEQHWDGLVIVDDSLTPLATVSVAQVLRLALPDYIEDDVSLASVYAERDADTFAESMRGRTVYEVRPRPSQHVTAVPPEATLLEVSAQMAVHFTSIVAVVEAGRTIGSVGAHAVLTAIVPR